MGVVSERVDGQADCTQKVMIWLFAVDGYCWYYIDRGFLVPVMIANEQNKTACECCCVNKLKLVAESALTVGTTIV